jgi:hypothetical protein
MWACEESEDQDPCLAGIRLAQSMSVERCRRIVLRSRGARMTAHSEYCASCKAQVLTAESPSGARVILDPDPIPTGTIVFIADGRIEYLNQRARRTISRVVPRYQAHAASCPQRHAKPTALRSTPPPAHGREVPRRWVVEH